MKMNRLEQIALEIRRKAVSDTQMWNIDGLAMIVMPTPDVYEASMHAAREKVKSGWAIPPDMRPTRLRQPRRVMDPSIDDLLARMR